MVDITDKASMIGVAVWVVWSEVLVKCALGVCCLSWVWTLAVVRKSLRSKVGFVNITIRIGINVVFRIIEMSVCLVSISV